ncbi:hypothetical protein CHU98_g7855 [Xylaria longipes]|nr:hypothetical protein CHU98_g7855 [Xylaria longipes]
MKSHGRISCHLVPAWANDEGDQRRLGAVINDESGMHMLTWYRPDAWVPGAWPGWRLAKSPEERRCYRLGKWGRRLHNSHSACLAVPTPSQLHHVWQHRVSNTSPPASARMTGKGRARSPSATHAHSTTLTFTLSNAFLPPSATSRAPRTISCDALITPFSNSNLPLSRSPVAAPTPTPWPPARGRRG